MNNLNYFKKKHLNEIRSIAYQGQLIFNYQKQILQIFGQQIIFDKNLLQYIKINLNIIIPIKDVFIFDCINLLPILIVHTFKLIF